MIKYSLDKRFYLYMKELCEEESVKITDISTILYSILLEKRLYDFAPNNISRKDIHIICDQMKNIFPSIKKRIQVKKFFTYQKYFLLIFMKLLQQKKYQKDYPPQMKSTFASLMTIMSTFYSVLSQRTGIVIFQQNQRNP